MSTFYYLAYGSNLHPVRLNDEARCPSAKLLGTIKLPNKKLAFHKISKKDGSGKCNFYEDENSSLWCALYEISMDDKERLNKAEGVRNGYIEEMLEVDLKGTIFKAIIYIAANTYIDPNQIPYDWYKELVLEGVRYHQFSEEYISSIESVKSKQDEDERRVREGAETLKKMKAEV